VSEGLEPYRAAVYEAIQPLDEYHCVRMEDFGARDNQSEEVCRQKVAECDIFFGILGQRYGSCPPGSDTSYTEIEYDTAMKESKVVLMFPSTEEFPVPAHLIETPEKRERIKAFRQRVLAERHVEFFDSESDLVKGVLTALFNCRDLLPAPKESLRTYLLFPWVVSEGTIDTGIVISNTGSDPFGTVGKARVCKFHYYGPTKLYGIHGMKPTTDPPAPQTSAVVMPGEILAHVFSQNTTATNYLGSRTGFSGYVIVECDFPCAHGVASLTSGQTPLSFYLATVIKRDRSGE
jgi:Domain of unknown function (DUF4062)